MQSKIFDKHFLFIVGSDALLLSLAWYASFLLRFNFHIPTDTYGLLVRLLPLIVVLKIVVFYVFNLYRGMWRYAGLGDMFSIVKASFFCSISIFFIMYFVQGFVGFARSVLIIDGLVTIGLVCVYRVSVRLYFWMGIKDNSARINIMSALFGKNHQGPDRKRLLIIGAGDCGEKIFREIHDNARLTYEVVGFIDDQINKIGRQIHGINVFGPIEDLNHIGSQLRVDETLIAIPSASSQQMRDIVSISENSGLPYKTLPGMGELIDGKISVKAIRDVAYRDLLGREVIRLEEERIGQYIEKSAVLVTGGGGSIGSELCRQICRFKPKQLILYEQAESSLYAIDLELRNSYPYIEIVPVLADIRNRPQLSATFEKYHPKVVFHAAAYKHVPMLEIQPWEAVGNNIVGTRNLVEAANHAGVERFVFVSTDKAVRPTNSMGASKRASERIIQGQSDCQVSATRYITVRFGNVVGSVGSVVPLFKQQIEKGGPITVTHPDVTRYFMTIPEACQLILQAGAMGEGGEIFLLDMGTPVKIVDMARDLIRLSGYEPDVDIKIQFIGLRPGEKLYEELITEGEGVIPTSHEKIMVLRGQVCDQALLNGQIDELAKIAESRDAERIRNKLKEIVAEYAPGSIG